MHVETEHTPAVLLVDDERTFLDSCEIALEVAGIDEVVATTDARHVPTLLQRQPFGAMVLDLRMPHVSGEALLTRVAQDYPELPVVVVTGVNDVATAVDCLKRGATDYIVKPVEHGTYVDKVRAALRSREAATAGERAGAGGAAPQVEAVSGILTRNARMRSALRYAEAIAPSPRPVLVTGETGTGKELVARALHELSGRRGAFVPVNAAGLDDHLFSDTLFGHEKGAYTGAERARAGLVERAVDGTLFLDEIGDLRPASQTKLLRLLEEGEYYPLGSDRLKRARTRVIVATNRPIDPGGEPGFRTDLYYRLNTHRVQLPPLRERRDDLPLLVEHFLREAAQALGRPTPALPRGLYALLETHPFPGNIRELQSMVLDAAVQQRGNRLSLRPFREAVERGPEAGVPTPDWPAAWAVPEGALDPESTGLPTLQATECYLIKAALRRANGNQSVAARMLGLSRYALMRRLQRHAIVM